MEIKQAVFGLFENRASAHSALEELDDAGFTQEQVSMLAKEDVLRDYAAEYDSSATAAGATGGAMVGGIIGLILSAAAFTIPGIGPVIGVGTFISTLGITTAGAGIGALTGGLAGAFIDMGTDEEYANKYEIAIREGHMLVAVETDNDTSAAAKDILLRHGAHDVHVHAPTEVRTGERAHV